MIGVEKRSKVSDVSPTMKTQLLKLCLNVQSSRPHNNYSWIIEIPGRSKKL